MTLSGNAFARLFAVGVAIAVHLAVIFWMSHGARLATGHSEAQRTFFVVRIIDSRPRPSSTEDVRQVLQPSGPRPPTRARKAHRNPGEQPLPTSAAAVEAQPIRTGDVVEVPSAASQANATQPALRVDQTAIQAAAAAAVRGSPLVALAVASENPTLQSNVERAIASSGRRDCKNAYSATGLLALPLILVDTAREKCRW